MLTLRAAAALLAADDPDALTRLAAACGCDGPPHPLAPLDRDRLGLAVIGGDPAAVGVRVARGPGCLRALLIDIGPAAGCASFREMLPRVAARMARRTPHVGWLCIAASRDRGRPLALVSWSADRNPPRVAALALDRDDVVDSDAETLCALAAAAGPDDALTHARWLAVLGRDSLTQRFYRALDRAVDRLAHTMIVPGAARRVTDGNRRSLALVCTSRLLFLAFLEAKGWLDSDRGFLARTYAECVGGAGRYHARVLRPLFFGTLNTPTRQRAPKAKAFGRIPFLNGGLFAPTSLEQRTRAEFTDEALGTLFGDVLERYRFTAREDSRTWSEAAVDPEMLGKAFESLMEPRERRVTGAFYTPQPMVERVAGEALVHALASPALSAADAGALLRGTPDAVLHPSLRNAVRVRIGQMRVLDPACGSGAFLVYALEALAMIAAAAGDQRTVSDRRRAVLTHSIFGVDVNPTAVWLCELRLWLSVVIETAECDPSSVSPLPNLDHNVRVGDALAGGAFCDRLLQARADVAAATSRTAHRLAILRERYARSAGARKHPRLETLQRAERARAIGAVERDLARVISARCDAVTAARGRDLFGDPAQRRPSDRARRRELRSRARMLRARLRALRDGAALPFMFAAQFADAEAAGGFNVVLGNPPWVRPHAVPLTERARLAREFRVTRGAAWIPTGSPRQGGHTFGAQVDLAALFVERAVSLTCDGGVVALLLPAKLWRCLAGGGVRRLLANETSIRTLEDWSAARSAFDAAVYPSLLVARKGVPRRNVVPAIAGSGASK
jgi:N-6 DNA Methylase